MCGNLSGLGSVDPFSIVWFSNVKGQAKTKTGIYSLPFRMTCSGNYDTQSGHTSHPKLLQILFSLFLLVFAVKDVDTNEKIADLETKIVELEKQNAGLKNKVSKLMTVLIKYHNILKMLLIAVTKYMYLL